MWLALTQMQMMFYHILMMLALQVYLTPMMVQAFY